MIRLLFSLLGLFTLFSGIVSVVWLLIIGGWRPALAGFIIGAVSPAAISLLSALLNFPAFLMSDKVRSGFSKMLLALMAQIMNVIITTFAAFGVFYLLCSKFKSFDSIPVLLFCYSIVTGAYSYLSYKDRMNGSMRIWSFFVTIGCFASIIFVYIFKSLIPILYAVPVCLLPAIALNLMMCYRAIKHESVLRDNNM